MPSISLSASASQTGTPLAHFWNFCVGAGRANEGLRADWQRQLRKAVAECGFKYIRFHGLYHDDMFVYREDENGTPIYNFQYINELFDTLLEIGIKPFVEFGFCPKALATKCGTVFWWNANASPPKDYAKWGELVRRTMLNWVERYGLEEVRSWYFEVWNEPNLHPFFTGTKSQYFQLYKTSVQAIKSVDAAFRVGGPATSNFVPDTRFDGETEDVIAQREVLVAKDLDALDWQPVWLGQFIDFCQRENLSVDFVSCHPYPTDWALDEHTPGGFRKSTRGVGATPRDLALVRQIVDASPFPEAEIHLTEWSSSSSPRDNTHDFLQAATYVTKANLDSIGSVDSLSYWTFTDIFEEGGAGDTIFHGGFGMINLQGVVKPTFHAYRFLNQLGDELLAKTDGGVVTRHSATGKLTAMAWHYPEEMPLSAPASFDGRDKAYETLALGTPGEIRLELYSQPGATFQIETLDQTHGNALDAWTKMGSPDPLTREQTRQATASRRSHAERNRRRRRRWPAPPYPRNRPVERGSHSGKACGFEFNTGRQVAVHDTSDMHIPRSFLRAFAFVMCLVAFLPAIAVGGTVSVDSLSCEYLKNPLGIDVSTPRFLWQLKDSQSTRGQIQTAYRILVASSPALLAKDQADVWDSGMVSSAQNALVPYAGKPLVSNQDCYWKVQVWDKDRKPSDWSAPARFSMGLLDAKDWTGAWIRHPGTPNQAVTRALDVTQAVSALVRGSELALTVNPATLSKGVDPAAGVRKKLVVSYTVNGAESNVAVVDGQKMQVVAAAGKALSIKKAVYGDLPFPVLDVSELAQAAISGNQVSLKVDKGSLTSGVDPAPRRKKSLRVQYRVGNRARTVTLEEGKEAVINLPESNDGSGALTIDSAVYGDLSIPAPSATTLKLAPDGTIPVEAHVWYRRSLALPQGASSAFVHVASIGYHELYINGQKADDRVLAPALTRLDKRVLYVTYDVAKLLHAGSNTIALWTGPGWSRYDGYKTFPALRVQLDAITGDGKKINLGSDKSWRCEVSSSENLGSYQFADYGGERVDARKEQSSWNANGFDDKGWKSALETPVDVTLSAQMVEPTRIIETLAAKAIEDRPNGAYRVDMGKNFTGWLQLRINGQSPGNVVTIQVADDPTTVQDFGQKEEYICKGGAGEVFRNRFNYVAGRYVMLTGLKSKPQLADITGLALATDIERTGHFSCSKPLFNQIYETDLWTYRVNTTEGFTADCPHRERLGYGEVATSCAWGIGLPNYNVGAFYTKNVRDRADVQDNEGMVSNTAPQLSGWGGPMWASAGLNVSWDLYQTYGDTRLLETNYDSSKRWLEFLNKSVKDGILLRYKGHPGMFLGDWAAPGQRREMGDSPEAEYFNNCVYAMNLGSFAQMAQVLGKTEDASLYGQRLKDLRQNVHAKFFNPETNIYANGTQVQQAFALLTGITPEDRRAAVAAKIDADLTQNQRYLDVGSPSLPVLLKYMTEVAAHPEVLATPLSSTTQPSYGHFLANGDTAWPEYWDGDVTSRMHTCYTGIAAWFTKSVGGLRPDPAQPGGQAYLIKPTLVGDLTFAEAGTESLYGPITSRWKKNAGKVILRVTIPPNSTATVYVPTSEAAQIREGDFPASRAPGVSYLRTEGGSAVFAIGSGTYAFTSVLK